MRWLTVCLLAVSLLSACGRPYVVPPQVREEVRAGLLADIRITQWGRHRFSGLLALREKDGILPFAVLDATGLTLLEGVLVSGTEPVDATLRGPLSRRPVGEFLATALWRIFQLEPATRPCSSAMLSRVCAQEKEGGDLTKYEKAGPFTRWEMTWRPDDHGDLVLYAQPWLALRITLEVRKRGME